MGKTKQPRTCRGCFVLLSDNSLYGEGDSCGGAVDFGLVVAVGFALAGCLPLLVADPALDLPGPVIGPTVVLVVGPMVVLVVGPMVALESGPMVACACGFIPWPGCPWIFWAGFETAGPDVAGPGAWAITRAASEKLLAMAIAKIVELVCFIFVTLSFLISNLHRTAI